MTKNRFLVKHENFSENAFNDCVRYSKAKILFIDGQSASIEITPKNPSMRKEFLKLCLDRWESCGFKLTKQ